jgi:Amt family ammonium transporter
MFAIITVAIIASAVAERVKFSSFLVFATFWLILVYSPIAHWVWGEGGWLNTLGAYDFAGGAVVHINIGFGALALAIVIGPRKNYKKEPMNPYSIPYVLLGLALLWVGWFGFNGGSELAADPRAVQAMVNTHMAACAGGFIWMCMGWKQTGKASLLGFASGALAGLATITPAAGYVQTWVALVIGFSAGALCYFTLEFRNNRTKIDESLDAWAVHGCGGVWGVLACGIFATIGTASVPAVSLLTGNTTQIWIQALLVVTTAAYSFVVTYVIAWVINKTIGLRVKDDEEYVGLDITQHGETI